VERRADLHVHTYYSDGTFSPEEAVREARDTGLSTIAICDHDCTDGIEESQEAGSKYGVEVIPGAEITSEKDGLEIHILGYFIDHKSKPLVELLKELKASRIKRIYSMLKKLKLHGVDLSPEAVFSLSKRGTIGRLHLGTALYNEGFVSTKREAFSKYIGDKAPCYVRRFNISPETVIETILKAGGVPVYAHPKVMGRDDFIPSFIRAGLRGIEVYHSDHKKNTSSHYHDLAEKYGLIMTGGSDCHGKGKTKKLMGNVMMPYAVVDELKRESEDIQRAQR